MREAAQKITETNRKAVARHIARKEIDAQGNIWRATQQIVCQRTCEKKEEGKGRFLTRNVEEQQPLREHGYRSGEFVGSQVDGSEILQLRD